MEAFYAQRDTNNHNGPTWTLMGHHNHRSRLSRQAGTGKSFDELEASLLRGQKLQGVLTSNEVQEIVRARGWEAEYPLFTTGEGLRPNGGHEEIRGE